MDPKIGWLQAELMCKAYNTWNNVVTNSQLSSQQQQQNKSIEHVSSTASLNNTNTNNNNNNNTDNSHDTTNITITSQDNVNHNNSNNNNNNETSTLDLTKRKSSNILDSTKQQQQQQQQQFQRQINKASIYNLSLKSFVNDPLSTPWKSVDFNYVNGYAGLHEEILMFNNYISPTIEELYMRDEIIRKIIRTIKSELPNAQVDVYGSYKTGLFLPTSDIDMVVLGEWKKLPLNCLKEAIIRDKISDDENVKVLDKASVPIIKVIEINTELKIDISFNTNNGIKSALLIQNFLNEFPSLKPLVMVLKQFLLQCDYNEVYTGGIGSYSLILMTISFLQMHPRIDPYSANENLGILLIEFFELYGKYFNYIKTAIRINDGGSYLMKDDVRKQFASGTSVLCIEDPLNVANDAGKSSFGALKVRQAFEYAYLTLSYAILPQNKFLLKQYPSILGRILRITKDVYDYRLKIKNLYKDKIVQLNSTSNSSSSSKIMIDKCLHLNDNKSNNFKSLPIIDNLKFKLKQQIADANIIINKFEDNSIQKVKFYIGDNNNSTSSSTYTNNDINNNVNNNNENLIIKNFYNNCLFVKSSNNNNLNKNNSNIIQKTTNTTNATIT